MTENDFKLNNHLQIISSINHHDYLFIEQVISQTLVLFKKKKKVPNPNRTGSMKAS